MSWVIPADPVLWLGLCFGPASWSDTFCSKDMSRDPPALGKKKHFALCEPHEMQSQGYRGQVWELELPRVVSWLWETKRQQKSV